MSKKNSLRILVACEFSGIVRDAFVKQGFENTWSCDLLPTEREGNHYQGDVFDIINDGWDMMIAHPPCRYLCNASTGHLYKDYERWEKMYEGADFFLRLLDYEDIKYRAIENSIMNKYAKSICGEYSQIIHPYQHGHPESKRTCLWLRNLPLITPTDDVTELYRSLPYKERVKRDNLGPSPDRWKKRAETFTGIANAFAIQWGKFLREELC